MSHNPPSTAVVVSSSLREISSHGSHVDALTAACDVALHVDDYAPKRFLFSDDKVSHLFGLDAEALAVSAKEVPQAFGAYRLAVLEYEGSCTKQLNALTWALKTLYALSERPDADTDRIHAAAEPIVNLLVQHWGVGNDFLTASAERGWAERHTRRPDLLPAEWRTL